MKAYYSQLENNGEVEMNFDTKQDLLNFVYTLPSYNKVYLLHLNKGIEGIPAIIYVDENSENIGNFINSFLFTDKKNVPELSPEVFTGEKSIDELQSNEIELIAVRNLFNQQVVCIQEYESFEDAYSVALTMQEENQLCYNND